MSISDKSKLDQWRLANYPNQVKAVPWQNYHVTIAFLGNVHCEEIDTVVDSVIALQKPYVAVTFDRLGFWQKPRAFWLGCSRCPDELNQYAHQVAKQVVKLGYKKPHKHYNPHVTLIRGVKSELPAPLQAPEFTFEFNEITLFESVSTAKGVKYVPLIQF